MAILKLAAFIMSVLGITYFDYATYFELNENYKYEMTR
jgi:hypothetical protein